MPAKLLIREVGQREFIQHNGEFPSEEEAEAKGEQLCIGGNVEAFQVWTLYCAKQRVWKLEDLANSIKVDQKETS